MPFTPEQIQAMLAAQNQAPPPGGFPVSLGDGPPPGAAAPPPFTVGFGAPSLSPVVPPPAMPPPQAQILPGQSDEQKLAERAALARQALHGSNLTPPPGAPAGAAPGAAAPQGPGDPTAALLMPGQGGGTPAHQAGLSQADQGMLGSLGDEGQGANDAVDRAVAQHQDAVDAFKKNSDALATDTMLGKEKYEQDMQRNQEDRQLLELEAKDSQAKADQQITDLQAQGIDPKKYLHDMSTGQRIAAGIAVLFGGLGSGPKGASGHDAGPNQALEIINQGIARDIDAQKANLAKSLDLAKTKRELSAKGFDERRAMLTAERESVQTTYGVAMNEIRQKAAMYKDNADVQQQAADAIAGLEAHRDERVGHLNEQAYQIMKSGERIVPGTGGGGITEADKEKIRARTADLVDKYNLTPEKAHAQALAERFAIGPGGGELNARPKDGAGKPMNARAARRVAELDTQDKAAAELDSLLEKGSSLSGADRARAASLAEELRNAGHKSIPENPLEVFSRSSVRRAGLSAVRDSIKHERDSLKSYAGGSGGGGGGDEDEDNPAGGKEEE